MSNFALTNSSTCAKPLKYILMNEEEKNQQQLNKTATPTEQLTSQAQPSKNYRELLRGRKNDLDVDSDEAIYDYLDNGFKEYDSMKAENEKARKASESMRKLIDSDRDARNIFDGLLSKTDEEGNPFSLVGYILNEHYDEIKDSESAEEALQKIAKKQDALAKEEEQKAERQKTREANYEKAEQALASAKKSVGADNKTSAEMLNWLLSEEDGSKGLMWRLPMFELTEDDFTKLLYAFMRDSELERATNAGRAEGREQKPGAMHRRTNAPTDLGSGTGGMEPEEEDENPTATRYGRMKPRFA